MVGQWPLRERLRGQLMLALYRAGRRRRRWGSTTTLGAPSWTKLGIEPSPALQQLYRSMLRQEAVLESVPLPSRAPEDQLGEVVKALLAGHLVDRVGAGVNAGVVNSDGLPGPGEVAAHLVKPSTVRPSTRETGACR